MDNPTLKFLWDILYVHINFLKKMDCVIFGKMKIFKNSTELSSPQNHSTILRLKVQMEVIRSQRLIEWCLQTAR